MPPSSSSRSYYLTSSGSSSSSSYYPLGRTSRLSTPTYTTSIGGTSSFTRIDSARFRSSSGLSPTGKSTYRSPMSAVSPAITHTSTYTSSLAYKPSSYLPHRDVSYTPLRDYSTISRTSRYDHAVKRDEYRLELEKRDESDSATDSGTEAGRDQLNASPSDCRAGSRSGASTSGFVSACSTVATSASSSRRGSVTQGTGRAAAEAADADVPAVGLNNLGNTCYMNAILQCLLRTKPLARAALAAEPEEGECKRALFNAFAKLVQRVARARPSRFVSTASSVSASAVSPLEFKREFELVAPRFRGYGQQDAHEFMCYVLDTLHDELAACKAEPELASVFLGELRSALRCQTCLHESVTVDSFMHLSVSLADENDNALYTCVDTDASLTIDRCVEQFMREEVLDGAEAPLCEQCNDRRPSTKRFSIRKLPKILVIHLKRFSGERYRCKNNTVVDFPLNGLQLSKFASAGETVPEYDLFAVVNHSGSLEFGHYTAYVRRRNVLNSEIESAVSDWTCFDDSRVTEIAAKKVVSSEAYLLFYEMRKS